MQHRVGRKLVALVLIATVLSSFPVVANASAVGTASAFESHHIFPREYFGGLGDKMNVQLRTVEHDFITYQTKLNTEWNGIRDRHPNEVKELTLYARREAVILEAERQISYSFFFRDFNGPSVDGRRPISVLIAWKLDGVSNLLYNAAYIFSVPSKLIHYPVYIFTKVDPDQRVGETLRFLAQIVSGTMASLTMLIVGSVIGFVAHPFLTLANLTVQPSDPLMTNLVRSIWDLLYGATLRPILNTVLWFLPSRGLAADSQSLPCLAVSVGIA